MKDKWGNYSLKSGKIEKSYTLKSCNKSKFRPEPKVSRINEPIIQEPEETLEQVLEKTYHKPPVEIKPKKKRKKKVKLG